MEFKIQFNKFLSVIGVLLSLLDNKYCYMFVSLVIGVILINLDKHNIKISADKVESIILGFTIGILFNYVLEIFMGLFFGYFLCNYDLTNNYILNNYDKVIQNIKKYSIRIEDNYIVKDNKNK